MINRLKIFLPIIIIIFLASVILIFHRKDQTWKSFNNQNSYNDVKYQLELGPRTMGSIAHEKTAEWIVTRLTNIHWQVETQQTTISGQSVKNIIAKRGSGSPWIILASHYDSRSVADRDPDPNKSTQPVPGADDGASTVAILLELARVIPSNADKQIWLVFFDNEDNGNDSGAGWDIGAQYFVSTLKGKPDAAVVLDMLGDKNLDIYMEKNSDPQINTQIWGVAKNLGFTQFIPTDKYSMIDDHIPFLNAGIRAVDIIDFDYPYWHTTQDTLDKISASSLKVVGDTILTWLQAYQN
jgi:glutaminyl-peptide cyclotransferase